MPEPPCHCRFSPGQHLRAPRWPPGNSSCLPEICSSHHSQGDLPRRHITKLHNTQKWKGFMGTTARVVFQKNEPDHITPLLGLLTMLPVSTLTSCPPLRELWGQMGLRVLPVLRMFVLGAPSARHTPPSPGRSFTPKVQMAPGRGLPPAAAPFCPPPCSSGSLAPASRVSSLSLHASGCLFFSLLPTRWLRPRPPFLLSPVPGASPLAHRGFSGSRVAVSRAWLVGLLSALTSVIPSASEGLEGL